MGPSWTTHLASRDSFSSSRHASQCDAHCAPTGRGCHQLGWDRQPVHASVILAVAELGWSSAPGSPAASTVETHFRLSMTLWRRESRRRRRCRRIARWSSPKTNSPCRSKTAIASLSLCAICKLIRGSRYSQKEHATLRSPVKINQTQLSLRRVPYGHLARASPLAVIAETKAKSRHSTVATWRVSLQAPLSALRIRECALSSAQPGVFPARGPTRVVRKRQHAAGAR
jgi:hypothetical protein